MEARKVVIYVTAILLAVSCFFVADRIVQGASFFLGADPSFNFNDPNGFMKPTAVILTMVDVTDGRFNLTPFLNTNDPYGDIDQSGICDTTDIFIWNNIWTESQRRSHRAWCFQVEKKASSAISRAMSYNQLWKGLELTTYNRSPVLVYKFRK